MSQLENINDLGLLALIKQSNMYLLLYSIQLSNLASSPSDASYFLVAMQSSDSHLLTVARWMSKALLIDHHV